ncbi:MAG: hypothetical protein KDA84_04555 [Planctomycetaceae bacterium]|nr:hypothetical protein [Planctomycetaceae bacterium]
MTMTLVIGMVVGLGLGVAHAWFLWRAAQPPFHRAGGVFLRVVPVAGVFVAAGFLGGLLPTVLGWALAFPASVAMIFLRSPR